MRAEDVETIAETIRLKTVTGESTPIMGEQSVKICIDQLRIRHRALVASMKNDLILGVDLISRHGLTVDPVKELQTGDGIDQRKTRFNRRKKTVVEDNKWTIARRRRDQGEDNDIGPLLRWKEDGINRPGWSEISDESPSFKALWAQ